MVQHYFTADLHFGHDKVAAHRGFGSTLTHDSTIYHALFETLKPGDHLWVLGDISGGQLEWSALALLNSIASTRKTQIHLVAGNHDSIHPMHRHSERHHDAFRSVFASIGTMGTFRHNKDKVMLSHFPYAGDRGEDRYPEYRLNDVGKPIVHGHTHSENVVSYSDKGSLQLCVSLDAWDMKPVPKHTLATIIDDHT